MAEALNRWPVTAECWDQCQTSPCGVCSGRRGTGRLFSLGTSNFPCPYHYTSAPTHLFICRWAE
jgi:hypothetical protein